MRSTSETSVARTECGAYSEMNSAVSSASGNAMTRATPATETVPTRMPAMPTVPCSGAHASSVKKDSP